MSKVIRINKETAGGIKDSKDYSNIGIVLLKQETMDELMSKVGQIGKRNEFQTHYWFLTFRSKQKDGSIIDIVVPTTFFNYDQEVTSAHIDFNFGDAAKVSDMVEPIHIAKSNELVETTNIIDDLNNNTGLEFEVLSTAFGTIHKHPGGSKHQAFSGTDYSKRLDDIGIVFPLSEAKDNIPSPAGIMAIDGDGKLRVAHFEHRLANGDINSNNGIVYKEARSAVYCYDTIKRSEAEKLCGLNDENISVLKTKGLSEESALIKKICETWDDIEWRASVDAVDNTLIREKVQKKIDNTKKNNQQQKVNYKKEVEIPKIRNPKTKQEKIRNLFSDSYEQGKGIEEGLGMSYKDIPFYAEDSVKRLKEVENILQELDLNEIKKYNYAKKVHTFIKASKVFWSGNEDFDEEYQKIRQYDIYEKTNNKMTSVMDQEIDSEIEDLIEEFIFEYNELKFELYGD